ISSSFVLLIIPYRSIPVLHLRPCIPAMWIRRDLRELRLVHLDAEPWALRQACIAVLIHLPVLGGDPWRLVEAVALAFLDQEEWYRCCDVNAGSEAKFRASVVRRHRDEERLGQRGNLL